jgi:hypothetical protein
MMHKHARSPHPWLKRDSWTLWEWWVLATVVGGLVGIGVAAIASGIAVHLGTVSTIALLYGVGAAQGIALGFSQWLVLRRYVKHVGLWVLATGLGALVAWSIGLKVIVALTLMLFRSTAFDNLTWAWLLAVFCLGVWVGTVLGLAQWCVLRTHVRRGILWVLANALAWGLGVSMVLMGVTKPGVMGVETALIGVSTGAMAGVVIGAVTGIALVWLLKSRLLRHH